MANKVQPRRSYSAGVAPSASELATHECAINWADGKLFVKREDGTVQSVTLGGSSYTLPIASASVLGGIKIGSGLTIDGNGVVTASGGGGGGSASIVEAATVAGFPSTGSASTLYISTDTQRVYRYDSTNSVYVELGPGA